MLLVMLEKGLVKRDDSVRPQIYRAAASQQRTQRQVLKDVIQKVLEGSAKSLVMQAIESGATSQAELEEIRKLSDEVSQVNKKNRGAENDRGADNS